MGSAKTALRNAARRRRAKLGKPLHGLRIIEHWPDRFADLAVAGYYPIKSEFDPRPLMQTLRLTGVRIGLPRMEGKSKPLSFHRWVPGDALEAGDYGVKEPLAASPPMDPDIILLPLLAFDARGGRLGYGGGYYDRTLAANPAALAMGVAFDEQEVEALPMQAHDRFLDAVLTPSGLRDFVRPAQAAGVTSCVASTMATDPGATSEQASAA